MTPATPGTIDGGWNYVYAAYAVYGLVVIGYGAMVLRRWTIARKPSPGGPR